MPAITSSHARFMVGALDHHKVLRAGSSATCLWFKSILYANAHPDLDGRVPLDVALGWLPDVAAGRIAERGPDGEWRAVTPMDVVLRAVEAGLFDPIEVDEGIGEVAPIHDFLDYNGSAKERAEATAKKAHGGRRRQEVAPPTQRDPNTGKFSRDRASDAELHGTHRAGSTGPAVPTAAASPPSSTSPVGTAAPVSGPAPTGEWETLGPEWQPVRVAMERRGYRLPPVCGSDVGGVPLAVLSDLMGVDGPQALAGRMAGAPGDLRVPRPFGDLVDWLAEDGDARRPAITPDDRDADRPHQSGEGLEAVGSTIEAATRDLVEASRGPASD